MGFELKIIDLHWIDGSADMPDDLCLHGHVFVKIGDEVVDDGTKDAWSMRVGVYRLLESVYQDHIASRGHGYFLTCCGSFMFIDEKTDRLTFMDCPYGQDWTVTHEGETVRLTTSAGTQVIIQLTQYKDIVFAFADEIKAFYEACSPKTPPIDDIERNAWKRFRRDWIRWRYPQETDEFVQTFMQVFPEHDVEHFTQKLIQTFPEHKEAYAEHLAFNGELLGHVFFGDVVSAPLSDLLRRKKDKPKIRGYIAFIEGMYATGDDAVRDIVGLTILAHLGDDNKVLKNAFTYFSQDLMRASKVIESGYGRREIQLRYKKNGKTRAKW